MPVTHNIPDPDPPIEESTSPDVRLLSPTVTSTPTAVRRLSRSTTGKKNKYDEYVSTICELAKTLCRMELPQQRYLEVPDGGGR